MSSIVMVLLSTMMAMALMTMFWPMKEESMEKSEEKMSFECGFMNMGASKTNFSTNFVMVVLMFLIFDIEVSILVTMTMSMAMNSNKFMMSMAFLGVVTILLLKEWWQGTVDWSA